MAIFIKAIYVNAKRMVPQSYSRADKNARSFTEFGMTVQA
jgi:hypothetical protein